MWCLVSQSIPGLSNRFDNNIIICIHFIPNDDYKLYSTIQIKYMPDVKFYNFPDKQSSLHIEAYSELYIQCHKTVLKVKNGHKYEVFKQGFAPLHAYICRIDPHRYQ